MKKEVLLFGIFMGFLLIVLKLMHTAFQLQKFTMEYYISLISFIFLACGVWFGSQLVRRKNPSSITIKGGEVELAELDKKRKELGLSKREYEVIQKLSEGLSNREIADQLHLSENTIKTHLANIFAKLNAKRRTEALKIARTEGLIN